MAKRRVLITVKTYPTLSAKYQEVACTAGLLEDGAWIRIYPIRFRFLKDDSRYKKFQWVEVDLEKSKKDNRPESFKIANPDDIKVLSAVGTERDWEHRRRLVLENSEIHTNFPKLIKAAHANKLSLATFKPSKIIDFVCEDSETDWPPEKLEAVLANLKQRDLFDEGAAEEFELVKKLPKKFSYRFEDDTGKPRKLMVEDWELGMLYWNCLRKHDEETAARKVREKYLKLARETDIHFFVGTTYEWHLRGTNPYVIIGVFYPPFEKQLRFI